MNLDDRTYMRERYAKRQGLHWDEKRARVLYVDRNGSARNRLGWRVAPYILAAICCAAIAATVFYLKVDGAQSFPESGSVRIAPWLNLDTPRGYLLIRRPFRNVVVELYKQGADEPTMSIYMRTGSTRHVPVPIGDYQMVAQSGTNWQGYDKKFGPAVPGLMVKKPISVREGGTIVIDMTQQERGA